MLSETNSEKNEAATPATPESGEYVVVARRYRPTRFDELIGQQQVSHALRNAIETHRVGHAYLFTGARGVGKTSTARIFGKALNCVKGPTGEPCNACDICLSVASGDDVDVLEIDGASNRGIEEIRQLRSTVNVRPSRARFKIYIIDEVHMLTSAAFNALLKTLEEPPEHVKFIFCTTDPEKIPITVLSRCQRFDFPPVETKDIQARLKEIAALEGVEAEDDALSILARRAAGSMRDSQSLLEQLLSFGSQTITASEIHQLLGTADGGCLIHLFDAILQRDVAAALTQIDQAVRGGVDAGQLAEQLLAVMRDVMVSAHGGADDLLMSQLAGDVERVRSIAKRLGPATTLAAMQVMDQAISRMRQSLHARTLLEMALVRICSLGDLDAVDRLVRQLAAGQPISAPHASASSASTPAEPPAIAQQPPRAAAALPSTESKTSSEVSPANGAEASKKNDVTPERPAAVETSSGNLDTQNARQVWTQAVDSLQDTTSEFARDFQDVAIAGPNTLVVTLRSPYNKEICERPERKRRLETAVSELIGRSMQIEFRVTAAQTKSTSRPTQTNRRQLMREVTQHPWVNEAISMFDGEVVDVRNRRKPKE